MLDRSTTCHLQSPFVSGFSHLKGVDVVSCSTLKRSTIMALDTYSHCVYYALKKHYQLCLLMLSPGTRALLSAALLIFHQVYFVSRKPL